MPTYAYACTECDHTFDLAQSFSEDPLTICPECEGRLRKVYGSIGITFKGSGFYRTDSRSSGSRTAGASSSGTSSGSSDSGASASDKGGSDKGGSDKGKAGSDGAASASAPSGATAAASS